MFRSIRKTNALQHEKGTTLVVVLVLVLIGGILGIAAMKSGDVEVQLSNNNRFKDVTFRVAEAASDNLINITNIIKVANEPTLVVTSDASIDDAVDADAEFRYLGVGVADGYSLGGTNGFRLLKFVSSSDASISAPVSRSGVVQGVEKLTLSRGN